MKQWMMVALMLSIWSCDKPKVLRSIKACEWSENKTNWVYKESYNCVSPEGEVLGEVRSEALIHDGTWSAFYKQDWCGSGIFVTVQAGMDCINKRLKQ